MVLPPIIHIAKQNIQKLVLVPKVEWSRLSTQKILLLMETVTVPTLQTNAPNHHHHNMKNTSSSSSNNRDEDMLTNNMMMMMTKVPLSVASLEVKKKNNNNNTTPQHLINEHLQIEDFSPKFRSKAKKLLKILKSSDQVAYMKHMEFVYKGSVVKNSNIIALIEDALSKVSPPCL